MSNSNEDRSNSMQHGNNRMLMGSTWYEKLYRRKTLPLSLLRTLSNGMKADIKPKGMRTGETRQNGVTLGVCWLFPTPATHGSSLKEQCLKFWGTKAASEHDLSANMDKEMLWRILVRGYACN